MGIQRENSRSPKLWWETKVYRNVDIILTPGPVAYCGKYTLSWGQTHYSAQGVSSVCRTDYLILQIYADPKYNSVFRSQLLDFKINFPVCLKKCMSLSRYRDYCNGAAVYKVWWCRDTYISSTIIRVKAYRGVEVQLHLFLTATLDRLIDQLQARVMSLIWANCC